MAESNRDFETRIFGLAQKVLAMLEAETADRRDIAATLDYLGVLFSCTPSLSIRLGGIVLSGDEQEAEASALD